MVSGYYGISESRSQTLSPGESCAAGVTTEWNNVPSAPLPPPALPPFDPLHTASFASERFLFEEDITMLWCGVLRQGGNDLDTQRAKILGEGTGLGFGEPRKLSHLTAVGLQPHA